VIVRTFIQPIRLELSGSVVAIQKLISEKFERRIGGLMNMGMYDVFVDETLNEDREIQVKCFDNTLHKYRIGDKVGSLQDYSTYYILDLYSGEFIFIKNNIFIGIIPMLIEGDNTPVFNKFGNKLTCE